MDKAAFLKVLGRNVSQHRKARQMTQRVAAKQAQISYRYFQSIEAGAANITVATLFRLAQLFAVHVCDLLPQKDAGESLSPDSSSGSSASGPKETKLAEAGRRQSTPSRSQENQGGNQDEMQGPREDEEEELETSLAND